MNKILISTFLSVFLLNISLAIPAPLSFFPKEKMEQSSSLPSTLAEGNITVFRDFECDDCENENTEDCSDCMTKFFNSFFARFTSNSVDISLEIYSLKLLQISQSLDYRNPEIFRFLRPPIFS